jgi:AcrR family transcriptional regulator
MASPITTADRILDASLRLFNERGFQSVPALKIARHLEISPGHLAYHFKTKNEIVMALFPRLENEMRTILSETRAPDRPLGPRESVQHTIDVFRTLWRYRFIFDALTPLLRDDPELRTRYLALQETVISTSEQVFDTLIALGEMKPVAPPSSTRSLSRSWWMMWLGWLRYEQIEHPHADAPPDAALFDGALQTHGVIQAYFSSDFSTAFLRELRKATAAPAAPALATRAKATANMRTRRRTG